jgi:hypothetical protein
MKEESIEASTNEQKAMMNGASRISKQQDAV